MVYEWDIIYCDIKTRYSWINISGLLAEFLQVFGCCNLRKLATGTRWAPTCFGPPGGRSSWDVGEPWGFDSMWNVWNMVEFLSCGFLTCLYFLLVGADWNRNGFFSPIVGMMMFNLTKSIIFQVKTTSFFGGGVPNITRFGTFQAGTRWIAVGLWTSQLRR